MNKDLLLNPVHPKFDSHQDKLRMLILNEALFTISTCTSVPEAIEAIKIVRDGYCRDKDFRKAECDLYLR